MQYGARHQLSSDKTTGTQGNSCSHLSCHFTTLPAWEKPKELLVLIKPKMPFIDAVDTLQTAASQVLRWQQKAHFSQGIKLQNSGYSQRPIHWNNCSRLEQIINFG